MHAGSASPSSMDLEDLCHRVPSLLQTLPSASLLNLMATSRQLRCLVQQSITILTLPRHCHPEDNTMLAAATTWPNVTKIELTDHCQLSWWPASPAWSWMKQLDLKWSTLGAAGAQKLQSIPLPHLSSLNMSRTGLNTAAIEQLAKASWPELQEHDVSNNQLGSAGMEQLCKGTWPQLTKLILGGNDLDTDAITWLVTANWPNLTSLHLAGNKLSASSMEMLASAAWRSTMLELNLTANKLDTRAVAALCVHPWACLIALDLSFNCLQPSAIGHLDPCCDAQVELLGLVNQQGASP